MRGNYLGIRLPTWAIGSISTNTEHRCARRLRKPRPLSAVSWGIPNPQSSTSNQSAVARASLRINAGGWRRPLPLPQLSPRTVRGMFGSPEPWKDQKRNRSTAISKRAQQSPEAQGLQRPRSMTLPRPKGLWRAGAVSARLRRVQRAAYKPPSGPAAARSATISRVQPLKLDDLTML